MFASQQAELHQRSMSCAGQYAASITTSAPAMKSAISTWLSSRRAVAVTRIGGLNARSRDLRFQQADVGLGVGGLAVEVADLDPVAIDQPHLADTTAGQSPRRPAAEPPDPSTAIPASRSRRWHSEGARAPPIWLK